MIKNDYRILKGLIKMEKKCNLPFVRLDDKLKEITGLKEEQAPTSQIIKGLFAYIKKNNLMIKKQS
jgi:chromatin remodeling complex protein RSC6